MKKSRTGFTLVELLISVSLLALISLVAVNIVTTLLRSSVKAQMAIDIEQASSFVFLKLENDIKKAYYAQVTESSTKLILSQGSPASPTQVVYKLAAGLGGGCSDNAINCVLLNTIKLTDDTQVNGRAAYSAVSLDVARSSFAVVNNAAGDPVAVNIKIKFIKPNMSTAKMFDAETSLDTTVVLRGGY